MMAVFTGGVRVDTKGYLVIKAGPLRDVRVHTLVAEAKLGRKLEKHEDVHHKDGDKLNCDPANLEIIDHRVHGWVLSAQGQFMKRREAEERRAWEAEFGPDSTYPPHKWRGRVLNDSGPKKREAQQEAA